MKNSQFIQRELVGSIMWDTLADDQLLRDPEKMKKQNKDPAAGILATGDRSFVFPRREKIMEALRVQRILERDGELDIKGLPYKKGQLVELIVMPQPAEQRRPRLTVGQFRQSGLIGIWKDRDDIQDSTVYARTLRDQAQTRRKHDSAG